MAILRQAHQGDGPLAADVDIGTLAVEADTFDREADLVLLEAALETLPAVGCEVLTLFYLQDLSLAELAETLGVPIGTDSSARAGCGVPRCLKGTTHDCDSASEPIDGCEPGTACTH